MGALEELVTFSPFDMRIGKVLKSRVKVRVVPADARVDMIFILM